MLPKELRKRMGIQAKNHFLVFGEGDTVILKKIELRDASKEWLKLKAAIDRKIKKYGELNEEEISNFVQAHRHRNKKSHGPAA